MRVFLVKVQALGLANVGSSCNGKVHHFLLADLPYRSVDVLDVLRNLFDSLNAAIVGNDLVFDFGGPEIEFDQLPHKMLVDADKFTRKDSSRIDVRGKWLETFIVSKDL